MSPLESQETHRLERLEAEVGPSPVFAGTQAILTVRARCAAGCDLRGHGVSIRDGDGAELGRAEFVEQDPLGWRTDAIAVAAPEEVTLTELTVEFPAQVRRGVRHGAARSSVAVETAPHATTTVVWDVPAAPAPGATLSFAVGVKCRCGCSLAGAPVEVVDGHGATIASTVLDEEPRPGTSALYHSRAAIVAGAEPGPVTYRVRFPGSDAASPHLPSEASFRVTVVPEPEARVRITALHDDGSPLSRAMVAMHPYRATTDDDGIAVIRASKGTYRLFVSRAKFVTFGAEVDLQRDVDLEARLTIEPEEDPSVFY